MKQPKPTPIKQDLYFVRLIDNKNFFIHPDKHLTNNKRDGFRVVEGYIGACVWPKHGALNFIASSKKGNIEIVRFNDVVSSIKDVDKTVVIRYEEARDMIACCFDNKEFTDWYDKNEAYFIKRGMFIAENLLKDENGKAIKYCFTFNFENPKQAIFVIYNYYDQKEICSFVYKRNKQNPLEPKIVLDYYDGKLFDGLGGDFVNLEKKATRKEEHQFMCEHTVRMCYAVMFYFAENKNIEFKDYNKNEQGDEDETEITFKNVTRKYYYTGYIDLNKAKVLRINAGELEKEKKRRGEYQRHIEKWSVRGHYRTLKNGNRIWIDAHERGEGNLEKRVYGDADEKEVNIIPKVFEVTRTEAIKTVPAVVDEVAISEIQKEKRKEKTFVNDWIVTPEEHPAPDFIPEPEQKKPNLLQRFFNWIIKFLQ